jgi:tape measure domain-containing protein
MKHPDIDIQVAREKEISEQAARQVEQLVADGMLREEAWEVVTAEVNKALQKLEVAAAEMRRSKL